MGINPPLDLVTMAGKKRKAGGFRDRLVGSAYERLEKKLDKLDRQFASDPDQMAHQVKQFTKEVQRSQKEGRVDEEEHDLLMEMAEDHDPHEREFPRLVDDLDEFYDGDMPTTPELEFGKDVNLDTLMKSKKDSFGSSFGRDEYEEYREKMSDEFLWESDEAASEGLHKEAQEPGGRVFHDVADEVSEAKARIVAELEEENQGSFGDSGDDSSYSEDESYRVDENGVEWWQDEDGIWWYREPGWEEWAEYYE